MHILIIYMTYLRPGDAGIRRFSELSKLWVEQHGHQVSVITSQLHYNLGEVYRDIQGQRVAVESDGAATVYRVAAPDTYGWSFAWRAWCQWRWAHNAARALHMVDRPDVVIASTPTLWVIYPMLAAKRRWGCPAVFDVRDIWPEAIVNMGIAKPWHPGIAYLSRIERIGCRTADHIVTTAQSQANNIVRRGLKPADKVTALPHGVSLDKYHAVKPEARERLRRQLGVGDGDKLLMYVGAHGPLYDLMQLVDLAGSLSDRPDIRIVSVGEGTQRRQLMAEIESRGLANIKMIGSIPYDDVPDYLSAADIACSIVKARAVPGWDDETKGIFRSAVFDYAAAKLPVVFNDPGFTVKELQDRAQAGLYGDTSQGVGQLAEHVRYLADHPEERRRMGDNNYREIAERYNRPEMAAKYVSILEGLAQRVRLRE